MTPLWTIHESPRLGPLTLVGAGRRLAGLLFERGAPALSEARGDSHAFADATRQLDEYLAGVRERFELELELRGTPLQQAVWRQLARIPYGETISYTELARRVGRPDCVRAVGGAVARTPIPIVIPCHRVVAADGALTGYRGGLRRKAALLSLEREVRP